MWRMTNCSFRERSNHAEPISRRQCMTLFPTPNPAGGQEQEAEFLGETAVVGLFDRRGPRPRMKINGIAHSARPKPDTAF
jgi:hypothetical protein